MFHITKRARVGEASGDEGVVDEVNAVPKDISKTASEGPTQVKLQAYPMDQGRRRFIKDWFDGAAWLAYSQTRNAAFCFACRHFGLGGVRSAWIVTGYNNWKNAAQQMDKHNDSEAHKHALAAWMQWRQDETRTVASLISSANAQIIKENRHYIGAVVNVVSLCCKQAIALRGHRESDDEPSYVNKGNYLAILNIVAEHDPVVAHRLSEGPKNAKYAHHSIQDGVIHAAAGLIREAISAEANENFYAIIADESRDTGHKEQMSLVIRYVTKDDQDNGKNIIKESFLRFAACGSLDAAGLCDTLLSNLRDCGIDLGGCVAQCYDGAAVMSGRCSGVQARVRELCPKAVYVHCFAHRLNLIIVDVVHSTARADDLFTLLQLLHNFLSQPIVHQKYIDAQKRRFPNVQPREVHSLSDTRWVCRYEACETLSLTLPAIIDVLNNLEDATGERGGTARALLAQLDTCSIIHLCTFKFLLKICCRRKCGAPRQERDFGESSASNQDHLHVVGEACRFVVRPRVGRYLQGDRGHLRSIRSSTAPITSSPQSTRWWS